MSAKMKGVTNYSKIKGNFRITPRRFPNVSTLWSLGLALDLSIEEIEACRTDAATDIEHATLKMLYVWYKKGSGSLESGSSKDVQLTDAMEEAGLGNYV